MAQELAWKLAHHDPNGCRRLRTLHRDDSQPQPKPPHEQAALHIRRLANSPRAMPHGYQLLLPTRCLDWVRAVA